MSSIQFESGQEKEKIREKLRDARAEMLEKAKRDAKERAEREIKKKLSGEVDWMQPSLAKKLNEMRKSSKPTKQSKKKKSKKKSMKSKKSKKSGKKRKRQSSSSEDTTDSASDSSDSSMEERESRKKAKKAKRKRSRKQSETSSDESDDNTETKVERKAAAAAPPSGAQSAPLERDSWMTDTPMLKTFSRDRKEKPNDKPAEAYDPKTSSRELNPYWKSTGTGMPTFQKPNENSDNEDATPRPKRRTSQAADKQKNWKKKPMQTTKDGNTPSRACRAPTTSQSSSSSAESEPEQLDIFNVKSFLTDQEMNELSARILKSELMGNHALADELKKKLDIARANRDSMRKSKEEELKKKGKAVSKPEHILLTRTDKRGNTRPLAPSTFVDTRDLYGGRKGRKNPPRRVETHVQGERVRYFADDDKRNLKQMFESEKSSTAADSNLQFAEIASKSKNPNDDLEDIFADEIRKNVSNEELERLEFQRAVQEQEKLAEQLANCVHCFDSDKMDKKLLISLGEKVYLALPWQVGLQPGHCIIAPMQHVSCCTHLDEDSWAEINHFRLAITRMFAAQKKDVVFFEIANNLQRRPHMTIHCIPIAEAQGEEAPFYFKKAIEESEQEWCINKQLVSLRGRSLLSSIPKGLPYFWVNFGMDIGFAHVIEDEGRFPPNFAQEIIGGMLHLEASSWRKPQKEQNPIAKVKIFSDWWKDFDCTA